MGNVIIFLVILIMTSCANKELEHEVKKPINNKTETENLSKIKNNSIDDCLPCCENCPVEYMQELSRVINDSINVIYVLMKGFDDKDCCIYEFAELVNNRPFSDNYRQQHVFLLDVNDINIKDNINDLLPNDSLESYVIAHEYYDLNGMTTLWDPFNTGKYTKFKKYKDL